MLSKAILKFSIKRFIREPLILTFQLGAIVIFLFISGVDPPILQIEPLEFFIYKRAFLFSIFITLLLSAGILGREISNGFMNIILSKPLKKTDIYLSKFLATLLYCTALLIVFLLFVGGIITFIYRINTSFIVFLKVFFLLFIDEVSIIAFSNFLSVFTPRETNVLILGLIVIVIFVFSSFLASMNFYHNIEGIFSFVNPIKGPTIREEFLLKGTIPFRFVSGYIIYLATLSVCGIFIFNKKEIK